MKGALFAIMALCVAAEIKAQELTIDPEEVIQSVQEWFEDNFDEDALEDLGVDRGRVRQFLNEVRTKFRGTYVYDLGALRDTAIELLPVLEKFEETEPLAVWLRPHLDYLDVAEKLRRDATPPTPKPSRVPNPSAELQRSVWAREVKDRSLPPLANRHVSRLKEIFAAEKVPSELVWLAEVESSFDPRARSPAGAAGLFQLMPATARSLDLSVGLRDERLHPEKSARAAARYLRRLHERFGDWRLALAAYNAGETRVSNLLIQQKARTFDAIADRLPAETQMFVPKVEATIRRREGLALDELKLAGGR